MQGPPIDMTLESHHGLQWIPVIDPLPKIKLGMLGQIQTHDVFTASHSQQKPNLFLANAGRPTTMPNQPLRQTVTQPAPSGADDLNMFRAQAYLFGQFTEHGLLWRLIPPNAALGKLPGMLPNSSRPEQTSFCITQDDADVWPITLRVDHSENQQFKMDYLYLFFHNTALLTIANPRTDYDISYQVLQFSHL
jgi:hypothetical protein